MKNFYSEYYTRRKPLSFGLSLIRGYHRRLFNIASEQIPYFNLRKVMEVGAGFGHIARLCREHGISYCGIELNPQQTENLRVGGFNVCCGKRIGGGVFGVVWLSHVLEHCVDSGEARELISNIYGSLREGGCVFVVCPDLLHWNNYFFDVDWSHNYPTTLRRVNQLLIDCGFSVGYSKHFIWGSTNPLIVFFGGVLSRLIPFGFLDLFFVRVFGRPLCYSFMTLFGWRQIILIGKKEVS